MKKEFLMAGVTVILWSTLPAVSKLIISQLDAFSTTFYVSLIAALTLFVINLVRGGLKSYTKYSLKDYARITGLGFLGLGCYTMLYYAGISYLTSQIAAIINYMWPIMIVLFSCFILKEKLTVRKTSAMCISFAGMLLICLQGLFSLSAKGSAVGMLCCFAAAVCYGLYSALNKKYDYDQWIVLNVAFAVTALMSGVTCAATSGFPHIDLMILAGLLWVGIFVNAIAYVLWGIAMNSGETASISVMAYLCPFISLIFGRLLLDEHITALSLLGLVFIVGGVLIQTDMKGVLMRKKAEN